MHAAYAASLSVGITLVFYKMNRKNSLRAMFKHFLNLLFIHCLSTASRASLYAVLVLESEMFSCLYI